MNVVIISGRLGRDPETRYTQSGKSVTNFSVAVDDGFGENKRTIWVSVQAWEKTADIAGEYLRKGARVTVEGRLNTREYEKNGEKRVVTEVVANRLHVIDWPEREVDERPATRAPAPASSRSPQGSIADLTDDIPF